AIAIDGRTAGSLHLLPKIYQDLQKENVDVKIIFLNASNEALIKRFSETRRRHPLSKSCDIDADSLSLALKEAIKKERQLLTEIYELGGAVIDSSLLRPAQLQTWVKSTIEAPKNMLTLVFESFAFKRGLPVDADYVFDVRILPNPHYEEELRPLTGKNLEIQKWLENHDEVKQMQQDITAFLHKWIPAFVANHRSYLTVAIGCTGGQHRSVYFVEKLTQAFSKEWQTIARHRELD
ncbi:MAG: RNase adapter RapZ, partial [Saezia sp.]